jgi:hypothetical protein
MPNAPDVIAKTAEFAPFLYANNYSRIGAIEKPTSQTVIFSPWGDESVLLTVEEQSLALSTALNNVILPERFSAIYHADSKKMEFIYSAFKLAPMLDGRSFEFHYKGKAHTANYGPCSDRLLAIAECFRPSNKPTNTEHRNLGLIQAYVLQGKGENPYEGIEFVHPTSFWLSDVEWDDEAVHDLTQHLNFYMAYFDAKTPTVLFHIKKEEGIRAQPQSQFRHGKFPKIIRAQQLDEDLFHFWSAGRTGDPGRRFVYNYQILEYLAHYILDDGIRERVSKMMRAPHALDVVDDTVDAIVDAVSSSKIHDAQKIDALLQRAVDPAVLWQDINRNIDVFSVATDFEGGYSLKPLVKKGWTLNDFKTNWPGSFAGSLRGLRNALSHARENRMEVSIPPTKNNLTKLLPWTTLIGIAASEAMIFRVGA